MDEWPMLCIGPGQEHNATVGAWLKSLREDKGISRSAAADILDQPGRMLRDIEEGRHAPPPWELHQILSAYHVYYRIVNRRTIRCDYREVVYVGPLKEKDGKHLPIPSAAEKMGHVVVYLGGTTDPTIDRVLAILEEEHYR